MWIGREDALRVCTVIESEVILANALSGDDSDLAVTWTELAEYCNAVRRHLEKTIHSAAECILRSVAGFDQASCKIAHHLFGMMGDRYSHTATLMQATSIQG